VSERPHVRVLTMNVLGASNPDWERRRRVLRDTFTRLDPDIAALQEVPVGRPESVTALLPPGHVLLPLGRPSQDGTGAALLTRLAPRVLAEIDHRVTSRTRDFPWCATQLVEVGTPLGVLIVAHHKPSWQFGYEVEREQQALRAALAMEELVGDRHAVVLGDFDATPDSASMQSWRGRRSLDGVSVCYQDVWETLRPGDPGHTFSSENPLVRAGEVATALSRRIDYILVRSGRHGPTLVVDEVTQVLNHPVGGIWASDHFGVVADLGLPAHEPGTWGRVAPSG
jgi:endonuclease/exonuclease/phosphatase family metal-dependent hydrolase